jgi:hypothetical protein
MTIPPELIKPVDIDWLEKIISELEFVDPRKMKNLERQNYVRGVCSEYAPSLVVITKRLREALLEALDKWSEAISHTDRMYPSDHMRGEIRKRRTIADEGFVKPEPPWAAEARAAGWTPPK